jgi:hypothetical protein
MLRRTSHHAAIATCLRGSISNCGCKRAKPPAPGRSPSAGLIDRSRPNGFPELGADASAPGQVRAGFPRGKTFSRAVYPNLTSPIGGIAAYGFLIAERGALPPSGPTSATLWSDLAFPTVIDPEAPPIRPKRMPQTRSQPSAGGSSSPLQQCDRFPNPPPMAPMGGREAPWPSSTGTVVWPKISRPRSPALQPLSTSPRFNFSLGGTCHPLQPLRF